MKHIEAQNHLTKKQESEIIKIYQDVNSSEQEKTDAFEKLFFLNKGIITNELDKNMRRYNLPHEVFEDLIQDCCVEMLRLLKSFKLEKNVRFMTYASHSIRRVVVRYKENYARAYSLPKNFFSEVMSIKLRNPSKSASLRNITESRKRDMLDIYNAKEISMEQPIHTTRIGYTTDTVKDIIPQEKTKVIDTELLNELLHKLPKREKEIIVRFYGIAKESNFSKTAKVFGLSRERIRQLHNHACNKLKQMLEKRGIASCEDMFDFV